MMPLSEQNITVLYIFTKLSYWSSSDFIFSKCLLEIFAVAYRTLPSKISTKISGCVMSRPMRLVLSEKFQASLT